MIYIYNVNVYFTFILFKLLKKKVILFAFFIFTR